MPHALGLIAQTRAVSPLVGQLHMSMGRLLSSVAT
jgi:hypothetical protein